MSLPAPVVAYAFTAPDPVCGTIATLHIVFNKNATDNPLQFLWILPMNDSAPFLYMIIASETSDFLSYFNLTTSSFTGVINPFIHYPATDVTESDKAFIYVNNMPANPMISENTPIRVPIDIYNHLVIARAVQKKATPT